MCVCTQYHQSIQINFQLMQTKVSLRVQYQGKYLINNSCVYIHNNVEFVQWSKYKLSCENLIIKGVTKMVSRKGVWSLNLINEEFL